jgi:hypothetical protein
VVSAVFIPNICFWRLALTFQAYIDNIKAKTGKTPEDFRVLAQENGLLGPGVKASQIVAWLKQDFDLATVMQWRSGRRSSRNAGSKRSIRELDIVPYMRQILVYGTEAG